MVAGSAPPFWLVTTPLLHGRRQGTAARAKCAASTQAGAGAATRLPTGPWVGALSSQGVTHGQGLISVAGNTMVTWPAGMSLKAGTLLLERLEHLTHSAFFPLAHVHICNMAYVSFSFDNKRHQKMYIDLLPTEMHTVIWLQDLNESAKSIAPAPSQ